MQESSAHISYISTLFDARYIIEEEETPENISALDTLLRSMGAKEIAETQIGDRVSINLVGFVFTQPIFKQKFLNCILDVAPDSLFQTPIHWLKGMVPFDFYIMPLDIAIMSINPDMVKAILKHTAFLGEEKQDNINRNCVVVTSSFKRALEQYKVNDKSRINTILEQPTAEMSKQEEILAMLFKCCKESMWKARYGKDRSDLFPHFIAASFGVSIFTEPTCVKEAKLREICCAFFTKEELTAASADKNKPKVLVGKQGCCII